MPKHSFVCGVIAEIAKRYIFFIQWAAKFPRLVCKFLQIVWGDVD